MKFKAAVLGVGNMGATHVNALQESEYVKEVIGYEPESDRAQQREKELGITVTTDLNSIWADKEIQFVSIAAPNEFHSPLAIAAIDAGKAVLCEKPIAETLEESEELVRVAQAQNAFIQIGFELRYSTLYTTAKRWINEGLIGAPLNCHCTYICSEFHLKGSWRSLSQGSLIGEKLSHYLDAERWWIGTRVTDVYAQSAPNFVKYFNHPDNHQINLTFENQAIGSIRFIMGIAAETEARDALTESAEKQHDNGHELRFLIYGDKGAIETDVFKRRIRRWQFTDTPERLRSDIVETIRFPAEEGNRWYHNVHGQLLAVVKAFAEGRAPENPIEDSLETMKLCFAAEKSTKEHEIVRL